MSFRQEKVLPNIDHSYIANAMRMHNDTEYKALLADIKANGQRDPIEVWKGEVVDGRNRQRVCAELSIGVNVVYLPDSMSEEEVTKRAISSNKRRKDTPTDRAIMALNLLLSNTGWTFESVAASCDTSKEMIRKTKYLHNNYPEHLSVLAGGGAVTVFDNRLGVVKHHNKIGPLYTVLKSNDETKVCEVIENKVTYSDEAMDKMFHSETAKSEYKKRVGSYNRLATEGKELAYKELMKDYLRYKCSGEEQVAFNDKREMGLEGEGNE